MPKPKLTLLELLDSVPPWMCRLMAVEEKPLAPKRACVLRYRPISGARLVKASGIPRKRLAQMSWSPSFANCRVKDISRFMEACGIDFQRIDAQVRKFVNKHGAYMLRLAPQQLSRKRLRELDRQFEVWSESHKR